MKYAIVLVLLGLVATVAQGKHSAFTSRRASKLKRCIGSIQGSSSQFLEKLLESERDRRSELEEELQLYKRLVLGKNKSAAKPDSTYYKCKSFCEDFFDDDASASKSCLQECVKDFNKFTKELKDLDVAI